MSRSRPCSVASAGAVLIGSVLLAACSVDEPAASIGGHDAALASWPPPSSSPPPSSPPPPSAAPAATTVTLLTGDRVHLAAGADGRTRARLEPGPGRAGIHVSYRRAGRGADEDLHVVPADAMPLLAAGVVDPRLFNVTALARDGLATGGGPPLIVQLAGARGVAALTASGAALGAPLASIGARAVVDDGRGALWSALAARGGSGALAASGIRRIWLDGVAHPTLDASVAQVGAPTAWAAGATGAGALVAVLDTGVDRSHPDLRDQVREVRDFTDTDPDGRDDIGHGTHVASTIAGTGAASGGRYRGVAPGAGLLVGRVCVVGDCDYSDIIAGMEWAAPRARVVNMSLGGPPSDGSDPLSLAVDALSAAHGTLFVVAAGNSGIDFGVSAPSTADAALSVGSVTKSDQLSGFSDRGPRLGNAAIKPELVAPGTDIVAALPLTGPRPPPVDGFYGGLSGTSMATPHVAGAAALLAAAHPDWDGARLKTTLMTTALPLDGIGVYAQGAGRLDAARAVTQGAHASTGSLGFGRTLWPHDQAATVKSVMLHNDSDRDQVFTCGLDVRDGSGQPAPGGIFTLDTATITVPAHSSRALTVTYRPAPRSSGLYGGWLRATSGDTRVVVAVAVYQEAESYDLTIHQRGRDGGPGLAEVQLNAAGSRKIIDVWSFDGDGRATVRLARGEYAFVASVDTEAGPDSDAADGSAAPSITMFGDGGLVVDRDLTLDLDARQGLPVEAKVERPGAVASESSAVVDFGVSWGAWRTAIAPTVLYAVPSPRRDPQRLRFGSLHVLGPDPEAGAGADADADGDAGYRYRLAFLSRNGIPSELSHAVRDRDLARVDVTTHAQGVATVVDRSDEVTIDGTWMDGGYSTQQVPAQETVFLTSGDQVEWITTLVPRGGNLELWRAMGRYRPGRHTEHRNAAPIGPAFPADGGQGSSLRGAIGDGIDMMSFDPPLFSTSQPGHAAKTFRADTTLWRDGALIGTSPHLAAGFEVPAARGRYTLNVRASRREPWTHLATDVDATWTFDSERPAEQVAPMPMLAVRVRGHVDTMGWAPAGVPHVLTLTVERQHGDPPQPVTELGLEVSYDDGARWQRVPVLRVGSHALALVFHPATPGTVSFRTRAADAAGSTLRQTVIQSYRTR